MDFATDAFAQSSSISTTESRCNSRGNYKILMTPAGSYKYQLISEPNGFKLLPIIISDSFSDLKCGNYQVRVTNKSGFNTVYPFTVASDYIEPRPIGATVGHIQCP